MRPRSGLLGRFVIPLSLLVFLGAAVAEAIPGDAQIRAQLAGLRVPFIENQGQSDARVAYYAPTFAGTLFVTRQGELVYTFPEAKHSAPHDPAKIRPARSAWSLTETLVGGQAHPAAADPSSTGVSYFVGRDPDRWRRDVRSFGQVGLGEVWPGIAVSLVARGRSVEKVFTVSPGASVDDIRVRVGGGRGLSVDPGGALVAATGLGPVTFTAPVAYQERDGVRRTVPAAYRLEGDDYRFTVGPYDPTRPLVIDPLVQSSYLGGSAVDRALAVAIGATGDVYVAGETTSTNFPGTPGGAQETVAGNSDGFIAILNDALTSLIQVTYLGGSAFDAISALAISSTTGDVYVAGRTESANFPTTAGGAQAVFFGTSDAFVARLSDSLTTLVQSTFLGGFAYDAATSLALSSTGNVYVGGVTFSSDFPGTATGAQPAPGDACGLGCSGDGFVALLNGALTALTRATYLGGLREEVVVAMAVNATTGDVYVAGETGSTNFPGTLGGAQPASAGAPPGLIGIAEAFVARLSGDLTSLLQATYLGGTNNESATALVISSATGDVYVAGPTRSADFPGTAGSAQPALSSGFDAYVARLNAGLTTLLRSTYLGGSGLDSPHALAITPGTGDVYVAGRTESTNFPGTAGGAQPVNGGGADAFLARLTADLTTLIQATYLGGAGRFDEANGVAVSSGTGDVYVVGETRSPDFPGTSGGAQPVIGGGDIDAFVSRLALSLTVSDSGRNVCCADFDGDGNADILWRQDTGTVAEWFISGTSLLGTDIVSTAPNEWRIAGLGDFNADGKADIVWRHLPTGTVAIWLLDGATVLGTAVPGALGPEWTIVGVGDVNADGTSDIIWRNTSGAVLVWLLSGTTLVDSQVIGSASSAWQVAGVKDFNGDGKADIVWRQFPSGNVSIWLLDGLTVLTSGIIGSAPANWHIEGVGDFNFDTKADILWRQDSGEVAIWLVDGLAVLTSGIIGVATSDWRISGAGDFNGDDKADILWRQFPSGAVAIWLVDGLSITTTGIVGAASFSWQIQ